MLRVNLLSPEKRREGSLRILFVRAKTLLEFVLFLVLTIAIVTTATKLFLLNTLLAFATTSTSTNVAMRDVERAIRKTNQSLALLDRLQQEETPWAPFLIALTRLIPPPVTLSEIAINKKTKPHLVLKGKARTRTDLLAFKTTLERIPYFTDLSFPLANFLTPKDIDWQLETNLNFAAIAQINTDSKRTDTDSKRTDTDNKRTDTDNKRTDTDNK